MIFCLREPTVESVVARKSAFTPASIDALNNGHVKDPTTPGMALKVLSSGKKVWKYTRRIAASGELVRLSLGLFPACSIADARKWAEGLNEKVEQGIDPREAMRIEEERACMTMSRAHVLYMTAVNEGRASRAKRKNKPRTISEKQEIFDRDVPTKLKNKSIYDVTEKDLIDIVSRKGKTAKVRANRLAAELKVFFGWAASLRAALQRTTDSRPTRARRWPSPSRRRRRARAASSPTGGAVCAASTARRPTSARRASPPGPGTSRRAAQSEQRARVQP